MCAARRLAEQCPESCAATVAGSFAAHQLQCVTAPRHGSRWGPQDLDVFLQSSAAYEGAIQCVKELVVALGGTGYHLAREADRYGWPMDFEGDSFDPEEREDDDEYLETGMPTPYGFAPMAPFSAQQVHAVAVGEPLGAGLTHGYEGHRQPLPKPLRAQLRAQLPPTETVGAPRSYGLYTSMLLEVVQHPRHPICTAPPAKPLKIGPWMPAKQRNQYRPLLKVNLIHIGSRRAYQALPDKLLGEPAHGSVEHRIPPAQIVAEFDMHQCAVALRVDEQLRPLFVHDDAALRCLKEGCIEFTPFAFCSEPLDRTNAIDKVLRRVERYVGRGFEPRGAPAA